MKNFAAIVLSLSYLLVSTGVMLNMHYCSGELASVTFGSTNVSCCCNIEQESTSCCSYKQIFVHFDNDEQLTSFAPSVSKITLTAIIENIINGEIFFEQEEENSYKYVDISPPPKLPVWKTNCSPLFYG